VTSLDDGEAAGNEALETAGIYTYDQDSNLLANIWDRFRLLTPTMTMRTPSLPITGPLSTIHPNSTDSGIRQFQPELQPTRTNGAGQRIKKCDPKVGQEYFHYDLKGHLIAEDNPGGHNDCGVCLYGDQLWQ